MITYTFPADCPVAELRGRTFSDGTLSFDPKAGPNIDLGTYKAGNVVLFEGERVGGKSGLVVKLAGRPDLQAIVRADIARAEADRIARQEAADAALEAGVPGVREILRLANEAECEAERYVRDFDRMMDDGDNDGVRPPKPEDRSHAAKLTSLLAANPRAALYLKAKRQADGTHWADNTGAGAAARKAMEMLVAGATIEEAAEALAHRNKTDEWI